jgi:hypothetical protein
MVRNSRSPENPNNVAIGYVRVSTEEQATEGVSLDAQRAKVLAYCSSPTLRRWWPTTGDLLIRLNDGMTRLPSTTHGTGEGKPTAELIAAKIKGSGNRHTAPGGGIANTLRRIRNTGSAPCGAVHECPCFCAD